jgi:hypothetical protein
VQPLTHAQRVAPHPAIGGAGQLDDTGLPSARADDVTALTVELVRRATMLAARLTEASGLSPTDVTGLRALDELGAGPLTAKLDAIRGFLGRVLEGTAAHPAEFTESGSALR